MSRGTSSTSVPPEDFSIYPYQASKAAPNIFYVLFLISGFVHAVQTYRFKSWHFTVLLPWAAAIYTAGFIMRQVSAFHPGKIDIFIATEVLLFCAPPVYAAVNYFVLGRTLHYIPYLSPIHPGRVVTTFIGLDILIEIMTAHGASRVAQYTKPESVRIGLALIKATLLLQTALFLCFVAIQVVFHRRCVRAGVLTQNLRGILYVLYISNMLLLVRNLYRIVDVFLLGSGSPTETQEGYLYIFDALPMLINTFFLNVFFPAVFLPRSNKIFLSIDGSTERRGPGWQDKRHFILTIIDPFDLGGLMKGNDNKTRFWDHEEDYPPVSVEHRTAPLEPCQNRPLWAKIIDPFHIGGFLMHWSNKKAAEGSNAA